MKLDFFPKSVPAGTVTMAALFAVASPVQAEGPSTAVQQQDVLFKRLDADRDGRVSQAEAAAVKGFASAHAEADDNKDGFLSADEFIKGHAIYDRMRVARFASDSAITAKVKAALVADRALSPFDVSVETENGRVILSGFVSRGEDAAKAEKVAASVPGVVSVRNALEVK